MYCNLSSVDENSKKNSKIHLRCHMTSGTATHIQKKSWIERQPLTGYVCKSFQNILYSSNLECTLQQFALIFSKKSLPFETLSFQTEDKHH